MIEPIAVNVIPRLMWVSIDQFIEDASEENKKVAEAIRTKHDNMIVCLDFVDGTHEYHMVLDEGKTVIGRRQEDWLA